MSRFVLDSNNLWLFGNSDGTIQVVVGAYEPDLNTQDVPDLSHWRPMARIGTDAMSTHQELEVFGVVFSGQKLDELRKTIYDRRLCINREGFMVQWLYPGTGPKDAELCRRLNDLFEWSTYGVEIPTPLGTEWDRYQLATGKLMVEGTGLKWREKRIEELERLVDEKDKEIEELKKQSVKETIGNESGEEMEEVKKQLAFKDKKIGILRHALRLFL